MIYVFVQTARRTLAVNGSWYTVVWVTTIRQNE